MFQKLIQTDDDISSIVLRWTLAIVFFPHGAQKVLGWWGGNGFSGSMDYFTGTGMPWIVAFLVVMGEFLGPIGLAVGFLSRFAAFGLGVIMVGAIFIAHAQHGFFMNWYGNQQGEGFEYHLLAIGLSIAVMLKGSGALSIDRQLSR
ncbi:MAG: DoxX family protein [Acidobacteriota bacterium]